MSPTSPDSAALWVPSTSITDYGAITRALADDARREGGTVQACLL